MASCCVSSRFRKIAWRFSKVLCTPPCIALNTRVGSPANGVSRKTSAKRGTTVSQQQASGDYKRKPKNGTAWRMSSREFWVPHPSKYDSLEPPSILAKVLYPSLSDEHRE